MKTILILALAALCWYYYNKYQTLKRQMSAPVTTPTGDEPNDNPQVTSVPEKQIEDEQ